jgi:nitrogenase molybdenum-iron protein NifN
MCIRDRYNPEVIGVATSCLTETIGDDVGKIIKDLRKKIPCHLVAVSTPSFKGSHTIGFHDTIDAIVKTFCQQPSNVNGVFIAPPIISPADLRYIKGQCATFGIKPVLLPDYSETLDGGLWDAYTPLPQGGTPVSEISAAASHESTYIELGSGRENRTGSFLKSSFGTTSLSLDTPIGIEATDRFLGALSRISSVAIPQEIQNVRKRCIDAYIDAHKYVGGIRTFVFGDEDIVPSIAAYCCEIGLQPILCASEGKFKSALEKFLTQK